MTGDGPLAFLRPMGNDGPKIQTKVQVNVLREPSNSNKIDFKGLRLRTPDERQLGVLQLKANGPFREKIPAMVRIHIMLGCILQS